MPCWVDDRSGEGVWRRRLLLPAGFYRPIPSDLWVLLHAPSGTSLPAPRCRTVRGRLLLHRRRTQAGMRAWNVQQRHREHHRLQRAVHGRQVWCRCVREPHLRRSLCPRLLLRRRIVVAGSQPVSWWPVRRWWRHQRDVHRPMLRGVHLPQWQRLCNRTPLRLADVFLPARVGGACGGGRWVLHHAHHRPGVSAHRPAAVRGRLHVPWGWLPPRVPAGYMGFAAWAVCAAVRWLVSAW